MRSNVTTGITLVWATFGIVTPMLATVVPFTEDFTSSSANWVNFNSSAFLTYSAAGGPDGGAYASGTLNFFNRTVDSTPVVLRGRDDFNASGDAFVGNWATDGIRKVSAQVRHNAPQPLDFFLRASSLANFPGGFYGYVTVQPNTWTQVEYDVSPSSSQLVSYEGSDWGTIFSDVHNVLFGVSVPASLVTDQATYTFDLDKVSINTPEPTAAVLDALALGGVAIGWMRRFLHKNRTQG